MRVLHIASGRLYGGIERMLTTLAASTGIGSTLTFDFAVAAAGRLDEELRDRGAEVIPLGNVRLSRPGSLLRARGALRDLLRDRHYAAAVCHAPWSHAIFGGVVRTAGVPCILWQHDRATGTPLIERASRKIGADLVICNSLWTAQTAALLQPHTPCRIVYCPVRAEPAVAGDRAEIRNALGAAPSDVVVLAASRIEPWKGHLDVIRALAQLPARPWMLWVAGGAERAHERRCAAAIVAEVRRLGLEARVKLLGERRDVRRLLAGADLLAQGNVQPEPFGVVFAESLLAAVPVVTTNMGGAREIVAESCGRLVAPGDVAAFAGALDELISNTALRASLGAAGAVHAAALCDPSVVLPVLEAALLSVSIKAAA
jgi:glycosyltransferase involved in cell wall biosynthesis